MNKLIKLIILIFVALFPISSLLAQKMYQLVDMGLLNFTESSATSINNKGQVCGKGKDANQEFIFVWDSENKLKTTKTVPSSRPIINNDTILFGSRITRITQDQWEFNQETVYKWENPFSYFTFYYFSNFGYPKSQKNQAWGQIFKRSIVWDANDKQQVLIMNQNKFEIKNDDLAFDRETDYKVWILDNNDATRIDNDQFKAGFKINNNSQVVGCQFTNKANSLGFGTQKSDVKAAIYDFNDKSVRVLKFPSFSIGWDINDKGQIAGIFHDEIEDIIKGFLKGDLDDPIADLTVINNFSPSALNNNEQIVGRFLKGHNKDKPALWDKGLLHDFADITDLIDDNGQIWDSIDTLEDINDQGMIVGKGKYMGRVHGLLLIPVTR
jgi:hypothetical protein